jgi:hypothetical protein
MKKITKKNIKYGSDEYIVVDTGTIKGRGFDFSTVTHKNDELIVKCTYNKSKDMYFISITRVGAGDPKDRSYFTKPYKGLLFIALYGLPADLSADPILYDIGLNNYYRKVSKDLTLVEGKQQEEQ